MSKQRRGFGVIVALCCWSLSIGTSWAQTNGEQSSLHGIKSVRVVIERLASDVERDGLTLSQIRTDVELALRQAGIRVQSIENAGTEPGNPYLYVNLMTTKSEVLYAFTSYLYSLQVSLYQDVVLAREPSTTLSALTWQTKVLGSVPTANILELRKTLHDSVEQFLNVYLAANPK